MIKPIPGALAPSGRENSPSVCGRADSRRSYLLMGTTMTSDPGSGDELLRRAGVGDPNALAELFTRHRDRLRRMVRLRLDRRLQGRIDASDVLQEAQLEVLRRAPAYAAEPRLPPF